PNPKPNRHQNAAAAQGVVPRAPEFLDSLFGIKILSNRGVQDEPELQMTTPSYRLLLPVHSL
ncbi:MAG: hypothetical protein OEU92_26645, partial [Alphaproteobacteria bacterium]|nr:hypothetical protein [Alphaproteobacteria bacterium]